MPGTGTILLSDLHDRANEFSDWVGQQAASAQAAVGQAAETVSQAPSAFLSWADELHAQPQPEAVAPAAAPTSSDSLTTPPPPPPQTGGFLAPPASAAASAELQARDRGDEAIADRAVGLFRSLADAAQREILGSPEQRAANQAARDQLLEQAASPEQRDQALEAMVAGSPLDVLGRATPGLPLAGDAVSRARREQFETTEASQIPVVGGVLGGLIEDPTTLLPIGGGAKLAADTPEVAAAVARGVGSRQAGQIDAQAALRLGGAVAGGAAGYESTPEEAGLGERVARTAGGAVAGAIGAGSVASAARFRGPLEQQVLETLREGGLVAGPAAARPPRAGIPTVVDVSKQMMLSHPAGRIADVIGNTIELARGPASLALGGRSDDALTAMAASARAIPEAARAAASALGGDQLATLAEGARSTSARQPIFRVLAASDAFTRTLGEYQGMAAEASRLLREAGLKTSDPGAEAFLATHAADLFHAGAKEGADSVVSQVASAVAGRSGLQNVFNRYTRVKDGLLDSPNLKEQGLGALMDLFIPFSGIPVRAVEIAASRLPPGAQVSGIMKMAKELGAGNTAGFQRAFGETALETMIQVGIGKAIADGNITGPDDPVHPSSVRINGTWQNMKDFGVYALPMQVMAAWAEGYEKAGQKIPAGGDRAPLAQLTENYGPRFGAALNASLKPFAKALPGMDLLRLISSFGQGGATGAGLSLAQDAVSRLTAPGAARFVEDLTDPVARDVDRKGVASLWEGTMAAWPGLAQFLPEKIDPTTGAVLQKARSGLGTLLGQQQEVASPMTLEANRLAKLGYDTAPPKDYPESVSVGGARVELSPDEQRRVAEITGKTLGDLAPRLDAPDYQQASDERKAQYMRAFLNAASNARVAAVRDVIGADELRERIIKGQRTVGRLNERADAPGFVAPGGR